MGVTFLHVLDSLEIFSNLNDNPVQFNLKFAYEVGERAGLSNQSEEDYEFLLSRDLHLRLNLKIDGNLLETLGEVNIGIANRQITIGGRSSVRLDLIIDTLLSLSNTLYIGPFRNALNAGAKTDYLDIQIGQSFITQFRDLKNWQ